MFERFYQARNGNGFAFGTHCWSADLSLYEICGHLGYDYIWIDNEHGVMTLPMIYGVIVSAHASGAAAILRVPGTAPVNHRNPCHMSCLLLKNIF